MIKSLFFLFMIIVLSASVFASEFYSGWYWSYQNIDYTNEEILVSKNNLDVRFKGSIWINSTITDKHDWLTFGFSPVFNYRYDEYDKFNSSVGFQQDDSNGLTVYDTNRKVDYTVNFNSTFSSYEYNVSMPSLTGRNHIVYFSNFTLNNKIKKIGKAEYTFYYISQIDSESQSLRILFPNNLKVTHCPENGEIKYGNNYQVFTISGEDAREALYFVFVDTNEKEFLDTTSNIIYLIVGAFLGALIGLFIEFYKNRETVTGKTILENHKDYSVLKIKIPKK